jgi:hypothetical protein
MGTKAEFFLKGYPSKNSIDFSSGECRINLAPDAVKVNSLERLKKELINVTETSTLQITGPTDEEGLTRIAIDIKNLISIALGTSVVFDRFVYVSGTTTNLIERPMSKNDNAGQQIVPDFALRDFLEATMPKWSLLSKIEKDQIFIITDYLNQTTHGFIEDRILRTAQAWECAASYWTADVELDGDLIELRNRIKKTYKEWKSQKGTVDIDGSLGARLTSSIDQETLALRLNKLVVQNGVNAEKLGVDLRKLRNLRDQVAHTGKININGAEAIKYLQPAIRTLQLILLKRLSFEGLVYGEKDNFSTIEYIKEYFV